jgi:hypothetical protein
MIVGRLPVNAHILLWQNAINGKPDAMIAHNIGNIQKVLLIEQKQCGSSKRSGLQE